MSKLTLSANRSHAFVLATPIHQSLLASRFRSSATKITLKPHSHRHLRPRYPCITLSKSNPNPSPPLSPPPTKSTPIPLPPSSTSFLTLSYVLSFASISLPFILSLNETLSQNLPLFSTLPSYTSHFQITLYTALFAAVHSGLASLRPQVTPYIGERLYRVIFALLSIPSATAVIAFFISHRYDGPQLVSLHSLPFLHSSVYILTFISFLLLYPATFNLLEVAAIQKPGLRIFETGITKITRHPQLWGQILWCAAHTAWIGSSFTLSASLCLIAHHCFGVWNGDRRLRDRFGDEWWQFEKRTSILPFRAVVEGRQVLEVREFLRPAYLGVVAFVLAAYAAHPVVLRFVGGLKI